MRYSVGIGLLGRPGREGWETESEKSKNVSQNRFTRGERETRHILLRRLRRRRLPPPVGVPARP